MTGDNATIEADVAPTDTVRDELVDVERVHASEVPESGGAAGGRAGGVALALAPVLVLAAIVAAVLAGGDRILDGFGHNPPAADELLVERVEFVPGGTIRLHVTNPQASPITPAMVVIDDAIAYGVTGGLGRELGRHEDAVLEVPYPWIEDDPYAIGITSSSGITTVTDVPAAVRTVEVRRTGLAWGALIGGLVGIVPIALGLAWLPALRRAKPALLAAFVAFTGGLLLFLAIDAASEAMEVQARLLPAIGGAGLVAAGVVASAVGLSLVSRWLRGRGGSSRADSTRGATDAAVELDALRAARTLSVLIAIGIGVHNLGEGLAIGSSFALGEAALAVSLIVGFMVHNLTEGIGIAAPLASGRAPLRPIHAVALALAAGAPAILGIWLGRYVGGQLFATLCFAVAAGAALQVVFEVGRFVRRAPGGGFGAPGVQAGFALGMVAMWLTGSIAG